MPNKGVPDIPAKLRVATKWHACEYPAADGLRSPGSYYELGDGYVLVHTGPPEYACQSVSFRTTLYVAHLVHWLTGNLEGSIIAWTGSEWNVLPPGATPSTFLVHGAFSTADSFQEAVEKAKKMLGGPVVPAGPAGA